MFKNFIASIEDARRNLEIEYERTIEASRKGEPAPGPIFSTVNYDFKNMTHQDINDNWESIKKNLNTYKKK